MRFARRAVVIAMLALASGAGAVARADETVTTIARPAPISAYGGRVAWSAYDPATRRQRLMSRADGITAPVPVRSRGVPFDVDLGPGRGGRVVAVYSRCRREPGRPRIRTALSQMPGWSTGRGCDLYLYSFATGRERLLAATGAPHGSEFLPTVWRDRVAFARVQDRRPGRRAHLYLRQLGSAGASRRLPAGARSRYRVCSPPPRGCDREVLVPEPGPTAMDLRGRRLAFAWDSGAQDGPTSAVYLDTVRARGADRRRLEHRASGSVQAYAVVSPAFGDGTLTWSSIAFGERQVNRFRRLALASGDIGSERLPPAAAQDAFARPVLATATLGGRTLYELSGHTLPGEPGCTPQRPCNVDPGCTTTEPCEIRLTDPAGTAGTRLASAPRRR